MRKSAMIGSMLSYIAGLGSQLFAMPVKVMTDPDPWVPPEAKAIRIERKRKKIRFYDGGRTVKPPMNGKREITRRLRQIEAGTLTRANGLRTRAELGLPEVRA